MVQSYPAIVERGETCFGLCFPDLPGCVTVGETVQEVARMQPRVGLSGSTGFTANQQAARELRRAGTQS